MLLRAAHVALLLFAVSGGTYAQAPADSATPRAVASDSGRAPALTVDIPRVVLRGIPFTATVRGETPLRAGEFGAVELYVNGERVALEAGEADGAAVLAGANLRAASAPAVVEVRRAGAVVARAESRVLPGWVSIIPPLLAILVALAFRQVVPALFLGIVVGAWSLNGFSLAGLWAGLLESFQVFVLQSLLDEGHASIILFTFMIGGMVGIVSKAGGMHGVVNIISRWANTPARGQLATWLMGLVIFFDDYANSLIIGNTMRPVTDRVRVSREKLSFVVDATSAPVASLALVTTWIGFEVGLIGEALASIPELPMSGYSVFLESIPYRYYPIVMLIFVALVAWTGRDFGPMWKAEHRARTTGKVLGDDAKVDAATADGGDVMPVAGVPQRAINAILPVLVLVGGVVAGLFATGEGDTLREVIGSADSYKALMWASLLSVLTAGALAVGQRILTLEQAADAWFAGLRAMLFAMIILVLAWALAAITEQLHTGDFLGTALAGSLHPGLIPAVVFVVAALLSFATGTSWGTMGILMPLVVPVTWQILTASGDANPEHYYVLYAAVSCVLAGAVWGDHCSPISDTTILSSMASGSDHMAHVRTQLPYAVMVGVAGLLLGTLPTGFGVPWWIGMIASIAAVWVFLRVFGRPVADAAPAEDG